MKLEVRETRRVDRRKTVKSDIARARDAAAYTRGVEIMRASVQLAPIEFGNLRRSAYVSPPRRGKVRLGFGVKYALAVHERTDVKHAPGTQARYLRTPIDAARPTWKSDMAAKIKQLMATKASWGSGEFPSRPEV